MNSKNLNKKIKELNDIKDLELVRMEIYSVIVSMIFSKEEFKTNMEIAHLMDSMSIDYRDYVLKSRTIILSKVLRKVQKADENTLRKYIESIVEQHILNESNKNDTDRDIEIDKEEAEKKKSKMNKENYMKEMMKKYERI